MTRPQGRLAFGFMSFVFRIRDLVAPPDAVLRRMGILPGHTVLDFGCGPGGYSLAAARLVGPTGKVYALDVNPVAASAVQRVAEERRLGNITTVLADSAADVPNGSVDVAILHDVLHLLADPAKVIASLYRALKREGLLWVDDHHMRETAIISAVSSDGLFEASGSFKGTYGFKPVERS
ncbi:MAG TPA: methyltransferase domain-containing protein [Phycisphaerae bacterium]|nr:methyltransferase domain-containing protein [Phycisphaerae bacterium]